MYKAIIIDDESNARELLALELKEIAKDINIIAFCGSYEEAEAKLASIEVDIAFIDVIMPRGNGLDLLRNIPKRNFYPIFVSSHLEYAIEAIKEEAFDYILKPFTTDELKGTLDRFRSSISQVKSINLQNVSDKVVFEARDQSSSVFIPIEELSFLEADGSYTKIYYSDKEFVMSKNLKQVSSLLDPKMFFRCSNKYVVNVGQIDRIQHSNNIAILKDGSQIQISTRRKEALMKKLRNP